MGELDYRPNVLARALRTRRTMTLGLLVPDVGNPFFAELAAAIEDIVQDHGYTLLLGNTGGNPMQGDAQMQAMLDRQIDGIVCVGYLPSPASVTDTPIVVLDRYSESFRNVVVDGRGGARAATHHLAEHGHQRIACIGGPAGFNVSELRIDGWSSAMALNGYPTDDLMVRAPFTRAGGYAAMRELLAKDEPVSAVFASTDLQAIGALLACHEAGRRVPDHVAVIAFDGTRESEFSVPPLSVVQQPTDAVAAAAIEQLLRDDFTPGSLVSLDTTLVLRQSCGCPRPTNGR